jgi:hypothetical protein
VPAPRHLATLKKKSKGALPPSFNEADTLDKPSPIRDLPVLGEGQIKDTLRKRRCAWESLLAVDESVGAVIEELQKVGERRRTYVFFMSDNGYLRGEHRIRNNKRFLYEASSRLPFVARGPGIPRGRNSEDVVVNADLVSTILELSGASPGEVQDGRSLLPSLFDPSLEQGRAILLEAFAGDPILGVRTSRYLYTEWETDGAQPERELYDTDFDPFQLVNLIGDPNYEAVTEDLAGQLEELVDCAGPDCHETPQAQITVTTGGDGKGCAFEPITARLATSDDAAVAAVEFSVAGQPTGTDTTAPFEALLPSKALRSTLPEPAEVVARATFADGRRVARAFKIRVCR